MNVALVGVGMDAAWTMTLEARETLARADAIIGAERLLAGLSDDFSANRISQAYPEKVAAIIAGHPEWNNVCIALSGDIGLYSGAKRLLELLVDHDTLLVPGISTPQYFAARLRRPWQGMHLVSAHGVRCDVLAEVLNHPSVLFLTGGEVKPQDIVAALCAAGLHNAQVTVGEDLSYPNERITAAAAGEMLGVESFAPLSAVLVDNDKTFARRIRSAGVPDGEFIRGSAPMTKREVRALALSLLHLKEAGIAYDVGSGTGSVAVEMALIARRGRVYAVESDSDAFETLNKNREKFGTYNIESIRGSAPEALSPLPPPDAAFIGGSRGRMREIIAALLEKNPEVRLVVAALALETLSLAMIAMRELGVKNMDVTQMAASRAVARGDYHMLEGRNPVFLIEGGGS